MEIQLNCFYCSDFSYLNVLFNILNKILKINGKDIKKKKKDAKGTETATSCHRSQRPPRVRHCPGHRFGDRWAGGCPHLQESRMKERQGPREGT